MIINNFIEMLERGLIISDYDPISEVLSETINFIKEDRPLIINFITNSSLNFLPCYAFEDAIPFSTVSIFACEKVEFYLVLNFLN